MQNILVIDDDEALGDIVASGLAHIGYRVERAANGTEALGVLQRRDIDLVLTDINMPGMDGIEVIIQLAKLRPALPIVAMSGGGLFDRSLLLTNASHLGAVECLGKPFDLDDLFDAVARALEPGD